MLQEYEEEEDDDNDNDDNDDVEVVTTVEPTEVATDTTTAVVVLETVVEEDDDGDQELNQQLEGHEFVAGDSENIKPQNPNSSVGYHIIRLQNCFQQQPKLYTIRKFTIHFLVV